MPTLKRQWTVADLEDLPDDGNRYEVIDGELLVTSAGTFERSTPSDTRVGVLAEELTWSPAGASKPLVMDLSEFFATVLDR